MQLYLDNRKSYMNINIYFNEKEKKHSKIIVKACVNLRDFF